MSVCVNQWTARLEALSKKDSASPDMFDWLEQNRAGVRENYSSFVVVEDLIHEDAHLEALIVISCHRVSSKIRPFLALENAIATCSSIADIECNVDQQAPRDTTLWQSGICISIKYAYTCVYFMYGSPRGDHPFETTVRTHGADIRPSTP